MTEPRASIITIGDELLIGQTIDTNSAFIAQELNKIGIWVSRRTAIGDVKEEILSTLDDERSRSQVIIITGGLGPTADDITKPALCQYFGSDLIINTDVAEHVKGIFDRLKKPFTERNKKQAEVPHNCEVLHNERGTAPGMLFENDGVVFISLPGVPVEMMGLMEKEVIPRLKKKFTLPQIIHKTAVTIGQGESFLADSLKDFEASLPPHIKLAYLPHFRMVKLRLTARGSDGVALENEVNARFSELKKTVAEYLVADEDISLVEVIGKMLDEKGKFLASAESCTGGYIAHLITSRSGSSGSYKGGIISYANEAKELVLGVAHSTIVTHGAVSEETVKEMVEGVRERLNVDYAVATSGVMGPNGGTKEKPVGTVWIAVCSKNRTLAQKHFAHMDRKRNIEITALIALNMLRQFIIEEEAALS